MAKVTKIVRKMVYGLKKQGVTVDQNDDGRISKEEVKKILKGLEIEKAVAEKKLDEVRQSCAKDPSVYASLQKFRDAQFQICVRRNGGHHQIDLLRKLGPKIDLAKKLQRTVAKFSSPVKYMEGSFYNLKRGDQKVALGKDFSHNRNGEPDEALKEVE